MPMRWADTQLVAVVRVIKLSVGTPVSRMEGMVQPRKSNLRPYFPSQEIIISPQTPAPRMKGARRCLAGAGRDYALAGNPTGNRKRVLLER